MYLIDNIAANIKDFRKKQGLTQEELAEKLGLSFQTVSKWENAKSVPNTLILPTLASFLGCEIADLYKRPRASIAVPAGFEELLSLAYRHLEARREVGSVSGREQCIALLSPDGRRVFVRSCIDDRLDAGLAADEEKMLSDLAAEGMTVGKMVCVWAEGGLDLPSYAFRRGLLQLDPGNRNAEILMRGWNEEGQNCYHVLSMEQTLPWKDLAALDKS